MEETRRDVNEPEVVPGEDDGLPARERGRAAARVDDDIEDLAAHAAHELALRPPPLRVHPDYHDQMRRIRSQAKLRALLRTVPVYAKLLDEFPKAKIST